MTMTMPKPAAFTLDRFMNDATARAKFSDECGAASALVDGPRLGGE